VYRDLLALEPGSRWTRQRLLALDLRQDQEGADALFAQAFAEQSSGNREAAIATYEALIGVAPNHRKGLFNLAYAYMGGASRADWAKSVLLFDKVLGLYPDYTEALFHLATVHRKLANRALADEYDSRYLERGQHQDLRERARSRLAETVPGSDAKGAVGRGNPGSFGFHGRATVY
jgi:tetratricopeptide (TPR) repeat protein